MQMLMEPFAPWRRDLYRQLTRSTPAGFFPAADVLVSDEDVTVHLDLPGLRADDVEIELDGDVLAIRGERRFPYGEDKAGGATWRRIERPFGAFERSLRIPRGLSPDAIDAAMHDGVLTVKMRKPEKARPHRVDVRAEERQAEQVKSPESGRSEKQGAAA